MDIAEIEKCIKENYWDLLSEKGKKEVKNIAGEILDQYPSYGVKEAVESYYQNIRRNKK